MKKITKLLIIFFVSIITFTSCNIFNQITETMQLAKCEFNVQNANNVKIANVNVKNNSSLSIADVTNITSALVRKTLPLSLNLNMGVKNPSDKSALINSFNWICELDGHQIANGTVNQPYNVKANGVTTVPINVQTDIFKMFSDDGIDAVKNFIKSFSNGDNLSSRLTFKIKPSVNIGSTKLYYPAYITLSKEFK
jgi:LEA14-like dessication related protein